MRLLASCAILLSLCPLAKGIGYSDFPANLQSILDQRIASLNTGGGICIAGRVTFNDGTPVTGGTDVMVNLYKGVDEPLWVYSGGWFIMGRTLSSSYAGSGGKLVLRAFKYDPIDLSIVILNGQMTYAEAQMNKTAPENLANITGTVTDELERPFDHASVWLGYPFATHGMGTYPSQSLTTSSDGRFSFTGISVAEYYVSASANEYAYHYDDVIPPSGGTAVADRRLYPIRRIIIDYAYQADGSHSFTGGDIQAGTIDWLFQSGGVDFSQGRVEGYDPNDLRDLELHQAQDVMQFEVFYVNGHNGFYDAGAVPFDSITQAGTSYSTADRPCVVGHVYVVRTYEEDHYAKFIVNSNERWFETVLPGDPDPIEFSGYGLTIVLSAVSDEGKVYVRQYPGSPPGLYAALPRYLALSGMTGISFQADLQFRYEDAELAALGVSEEALVVARSLNQGNTWELLETYRDPANNLLQVHGLTSLGWFALGDGSRDSDGDGVVDLVDACPGTPVGLPVGANGCPLPIPGDFDGDFDVDQTDFGFFQLCLSGGDHPQPDPNCQKAKLDGDGDVDWHDLALFRKCMTGAGLVGNPNCLE